MRTCINNIIFRVCHNIGIYVRGIKVDKHATQVKDIFFFLTKFAVDIIIIIIAHYNIR